MSERDHGELAAAFSTGVQLGMALGRYEPPDAADATVAPCDDCSCAVGDDSVHLSVVTVPTSPEEELPVFVRDYLEAVGAVDGDDIVARVEVCPNEIRAFLR